MSIAAVNDGGPPTWVWGVWLAASVVMAVLFAWRRPKKSEPVVAPASANSGSMAVAPAPPDGTKLEYEPSVVKDPTLQVVPLLAVAGLVSFCVWVASQMVYVVVRHPAVPPGTTVPVEMPWPSADRAALSLLSNLAAYAVGVGLLIYGRGIAAIGYGIRRIPNGLLGGVIGLFIALPIIYFSLKATEWSLGRMGIDHSKKHELLKMLADDPSAFVRIAAVLAAVVVAPLFEELLFRGCIQGGLRRATGSPLVGIVVASTLFASIHLAWTIPPIFVLSLLFGVVYERTRNLWAVTIMHALFNAFSVLTTGAN